MAEVVILVPTRCDRRAEIRLQHLLQSLLLQSFRNVRVVVRDEGAVGVFSSRLVRQFVDLLSRDGVTVDYRRVRRPTGVAVARRELAAAVADEAYACFVDDDMCLAPHALALLHGLMEANPDWGFAQGQKIEADPGRSYWNDINALQAVDERAEPFQVWFGDAAFLLVRVEALRRVDWDVVTRYAVDNLPGEDVAMSVLIADRWPCYAVPAATAYHLSPAGTRWRWEPPSDLLQLELLRPHVSAETLRRALPHLADHV